MEQNRTQFEGVKIFDTTLRDGEQSPGISLDQIEKVEIAENLEDAGVDIIEAGFPAASTGDFEAVRAIAQNSQSATIAALARNTRSDIERAWEAIEPASADGRSRIHTFIATSDIHMKDKLKMTREQVKKEAAESVAFAKSFTDDVEFSPEDASRSDFDFMIEVLKIAVDNGASTLNIPDTVGYAIPKEYEARIREIRQRVPGDYVISTHCHQDLGLAVANTLAGVEGGARQVEVAMNGLGERAGNAALEEVVMALETRKDYFAVNGLALIGGERATRIETPKLFAVSRAVSELTGYPIQPNKAIIGSNAFAHESGIHQHGVEANPMTYEIMRGKDVGWQGEQFVVGKHSGKAGMKVRAKRIGFDNSLINHEVMSAFKSWADTNGREAADTEIEAIVARENGIELNDRFEFVDATIQGSGHNQTAVVEFIEDGKQKTGFAKVEGGAINAMIDAFKNKANIELTLDDFEAKGVTEGASSDGLVMFKVKNGNMEVTTVAIDSSVDQATIKAFVSGVNTLIRAKDRIS